MPYSVSVTYMFIIRFVLHEIFSVLLPPTALYDLEQQGCGLTHTKPFLKLCAFEGVYYVRIYVRDNGQPGAHRSES